MKPEQCWQNLAVAIIEQAVTDRKKALEKLSENPDDAAASYEIYETDRFFRSRWFEELLDFSGVETDRDSIMEALNDI